ncbi:MAG TPA: ABC transporter ATP-binding protein [Polyangiales bacterium]|nr:ABC transporter ATP-binding protein [Polyangiales bacterium]
MTRSEGELPTRWHSLWRTLQLGYRAEPRLLTLSFAMTLFGALPDALVALWLKLLADGVEQHRAPLLTAAALGLSASATLTWYLRTLFDRLDRRFRDRVAIALESHVARLQSSIATIEHQERPEYLDRLAMLRDQVFALDHMFHSLFATVGWVFRLVTTLILLMSVHPALLLLGVFALPTVGVASWRPGIERSVEERSTPHTRLARHLFLLGTTASPAKELRVTGLGPWLIEARRRSWQRWYDAVSRTRWSSAYFNALVWAVFGAAYVGAIVFVAVGLRAPAGSSVLVLVAGGVLSRYVGAFVSELGFLRGFWLDSSRRLTWLEDYAAASGTHTDAQVPARMTQGIRFEHVHFRYPGTEREVLQDVSLELPAGSVVAIVGENGAGKTTLVKLLCRLYAPTSGRIAIDGVDLSALPVPAWRKRLAGAFQDFFRFEFAAQNTVGLGDLPRLDERPAVENAIERAGASELVQQLQRGLDTQLGAEWDDGVEVSFGQWQKLALARGFMRDAPLLLVLDEPTAALDAETEHALFERYAAASQRSDDAGRITVLVSHRFSTVRMADLIIVLSGARVVEVGAHDALMAKQGTYAELFNIQATAFR